MTRSEYKYALDTLGWTHQELADKLGISRRATFRHTSGGTIPGPAARLLRLLVMLRLTMSDRKFHAIVEQLR